MSDPQQQSHSAAWRRLSLLSSPAKFSAAQVKHAELANAAAVAKEEKERQLLPFPTLTFCVHSLIGESGQQRRRQGFIISRLLADPLSGV